MTSANGIFSVLVRSQDIEEPIHFSQRIGNIVLGVVVWPCLCLNRPPFKLALELDKARLSIILHLFN